MMDGVAWLRRKNAFGVRASLRSWVESIIQDMPLAFVSHLCEESKPIFGIETLRLASVCI